MLLGTAKLGAHFHLAMLDCALVLGVESTSNKAGGVGFKVGVHCAAQYQFAVAYGVE